MEQNTGRRRFFINLGQMLGLATIAPLLFSSKVLAEEKRRARPGEGAPATGAAGGCADFPLVEPGKGTAAPVNYQFKHSDVKDASLKIERGGVPFEKQFCSSTSATCSFYGKCTTKKGEELGTCQIFPN
ncbi:MAG: hypothetical protein ACXVB1_18595, partial [Pseudobdellovibrionaceae bacterium]